MRNKCFHLYVSCVGSERIEKPFLLNEYMCVMNGSIIRETKSFCLTYSFFYGFMVACRNQSLLVLSDVQKYSKK